MANDSELNWMRVAQRFARRLDRRIERTKRRIGLRARPDRPITIAAYRGYGTADTLLAHGRVLLASDIRPARQHDPWWRNVLSAYRRLESDEVPDARVEARLGAARTTALTNAEGHFEAHLRLEQPLPAGGAWHHVDIRLDEHGPAVHARAPVLVPLRDARFGVISDLDDTVIHTGATSLLRMLRLTLFENAHTRIAFPGVAAFFRALHHGGGPSPRNPFFYVSSSPWNLYGYLGDFLELNDVPAGPLMLRDWGFSSLEALPFGHRSHKLDAIRRILDTYPELPFILVGDSGQKDPEIYREVVHDYRGRILAVYIRDVSADPLRSRRIQELASEVHQVGSALVLTDDTLGAAQHAAEHGWIQGRDLQRISAATLQNKVDARAHGEDAENGETVIVEP